MYHGIWDGVGAADCGRVVDVTIEEKNKTARLPRPLWETVNRHTHCPLYSLPGYHYRSHPNWLIRYIEAQHRIVQKHWKQSAAVKLTNPINHNRDFIPAATLALRNRSPLLPSVWCNVDQPPRKGALRARHQSVLVRWLLADWLPSVKGSRKRKCTRFSLATDT